MFLNQQQVIDQKNMIRDAGIRNDSDLRPTRVLRLTLDLTTARPVADPLQVSQPFNGYLFEDASDNAAEVRLSFTSREMHNVNNYVTLALNDSGLLSEESRSAFLSWDAQPGKTITLVFFLGIEFRSGSQRSEISGGVAISVGSSCSPEAPVTVTDAATLISAADPDYKLRNVRNMSSSDDMWISGTVAVTDDLGANPGIVIGPGEAYEWDGQGDIYGIMEAGKSADAALNIFQ